MIDFNKISQDRERISFSQGGIAKGCGAVMASNVKQKDQNKEDSSVVSGHKGLAKWFKQTADIGSKKKVDALPSVVGQNKRKMPKENTLNVCHELKL